MHVKVTAVPVDVVKVYEKVVEVRLHSILTSALDTGE